MLLREEVSQRRAHTYGLRRSGFPPRDFGPHLLIPRRRASLSKSRLLAAAPCSVLETGAGTFAGETRAQAHKVNLRVWFCVVQGKGKREMGRQPCCEKVGLKKGPWTAEEDQKLVTFLLSHGHCCWRLVPKLAGNQSVCLPLHFLA